MRWVSGTGGQGQSLSHLGSSSPSALDRLTCIHPPAQEGPEAHTQTEYRFLSPTLLHAHGHMHTRKHKKSSMKGFRLPALPWGNIPTMLMHASSSI